MKRVLIVLPGIIVWEKCQNSSDLDMILVRVNICIWNTSIHSNQQSRTKHYSDHLIILVKQRKRFILNKRLHTYWNTLTRTQFHLLREQYLHFIELRLNLFCGLLFARSKILRKTTLIDLFGVIFILYP